MKSHGELKVLPSLGGTPEAIAAHALAAAEQFLREESSLLAEEAGSDPQLLYEAAQIIRDRAPRTAPARSPEHVAFTLLVQAHALLRSRPGKRR